MPARKLVEPIVLGMAASAAAATGPVGLALQRGPATDQSGAEGRG